MVEEAMAMSLSLESGNGGTPLEEPHDPDLEKAMAMSFEVLPTQKKDVDGDTKDQESKRQEESKNQESKDMQRALALSIHSMNDPLNDMKANTPHEPVPAQEELDALCSEVNLYNMQCLVNMGFTKEQAIWGVKRANDANGSLDLALQHASWRCDADILMAKRRKLEELCKNAAGTTPKDVDKPEPPKPGSCDVLETMPMNTLEVTTAFEDQKLEAKQVEEGKTEVITAKDVHALYDPDPEFLRAKTMTLDEAWELGCESAKHWAPDDDKVNMKDATTEKPAVEEPKNDTAAAAQADTAQASPQDEAALRPDHLLQSLQPITPAEQRGPGKGRGRGRGKGKGRGRGKKVVEDEDKDSEQEPQEPDQGEGEGEGQVEEIPKTKKVRKPRGGKPVTATAEPSAASPPETKSRKRRKSAETEKKPKIPKDPKDSKTSKSKTKEIKEVKPKKGKAKGKGVEKADKSEKKAEQSRKSSAYHVAKRAALNQGKTQEEAIELARLAYQNTK
eukprot:s3056_g5.t1